MKIQNTTALNTQIQNNSYSTSFCAKLKLKDGFGFEKPFVKTVTDYFESNTPEGYTFVVAPAGKSVRNTGSNMQWELYNHNFLEKFDKGSISTEPDKIGEELVTQFNSAQNSIH